MAPRTRVTNPPNHSRGATPFPVVALLPVSDTPLVVAGIGLAFYPGSQSGPVGGGVAPCLIGGGLAVRAEDDV